MCHLRYFTFRFCVRCVSASLFGLALSVVLPIGAAVAQGDPAKLMRIISPYAPGGGTDVLARALGPRLNERYGQQVVVENRAGASGTIGAGFVAKSPADGNTILLTSTGHAAVPSLFNNLAYDHVRDLAPVSQLASGAMVLVVHPSLPAQSVKELIALAKARPGELNVGSSGNGSFSHLTAELFSLSSGMKFTHIPYKGAGAALVDVQGGRVPVYFMNLLSSVPLVKSGKLRALGVSSTQRSSISPDLPTIAESGLADFEMTNWYAVLVAAGTPREIVARLQQEVTRIMNTAELKERLMAEGLTVVGSTPAQFGEFLAREITKNARIIKAAGITQAS